jgi:Pyrimidine dimer DNA glycosylase
MRLWSLHPKYLDAKGLVAVWREGLLALKVLKGETIGYRRHPQLARFRTYKKPVEAVECYLWQIYLESRKRGYLFNSKKIGKPRISSKLKVTEGQLRFELVHLRSKLKTRNPSLCAELEGLIVPDAHPLFRRVPGDIAEWEKGKTV